MICSFPLCRWARGYVFILILAAAALGLTPPGQAAQLESMTFTEDREKDMEALSTFCLLHDISSADVLWANNCTFQDLTPGRQIYLPASQAQMLVVWQKQGSWKPKALVKTTSAALAERARGASGYPPVAPRPASPESAPAASDVPPKPQLTPPAKPAKPAPKPAPTEAKKKAPGKTAAPASGKPDTELKIKEDKEEAYDPILLLSPDGDATSGPMRLIISGDRVEVVRLPPRAIPRIPSRADLNKTFPPSQLPPIPDQPSGRGRLGVKMMWPVNGVVSSPFGPRGRRMHMGIDIPMPPGTPIRAARDGVVTATGTNSTPGFRGYGNFVLVDHGGGIKTLYAHCLKVSVKKGQHLRQGQIIATIGRTGRATTDHLHFEVRVNNKPVNPLPYLQNVRVARKK
ncbi:MAG: M23 family metallopeptidase [Fretibacterium sp.]|nr:M23 family metallopeptidase [Fretibacterium sp.]